MVSEYNIRLNPNCASVVNTGLKFKSGDKGIIFRIAVEELDTTGTTAKIVFWRANGTSVESDITGTNGIYSYKTLGNEFAVPGKTIADVKVYSEDDRVSTASFVFEVGVDTMDGLGEGAGGYSDRLEQLVSEAEEAGTMTEQAKVDLQSATANLNATEKDMEATVQNFKEAYGEVGALKPRGDWNGSTEYQIRDVVYHNSFSWICLVPNTGKEPSTANEAYWQQMTDLQSIISGTTTVGNSASLGGETSEAWQTKLDNIQTTSKGELLQEGWYRVAEYDCDAVNLAMGAMSNGCEITIKKPHYKTHGCEHKLLFLSVYSIQEFKTISSKSNTYNFITKIRHTYSGSKAYLEIYYNSSTGDVVYIGIQNPEDYTLKWKAITPTLTSETVDGVTVTTTYDIPANASPVTDLDLFKTVKSYENLDFNTALETGIYCSSKSPSSAGATNYPFDATGILEVLNGTKVITQNYYAYYGTIIYSRSKFHSDNWSEWKQLSTTEDLANYLPLSGGTVTGTFAPVIFNRNESGAIQTTIGFALNNSPVAYIGAKSNGELYAYKSTQQDLGQILHTGNSAKVAIQSSAPSDTSALWVDTANKVIKAYIDGAWTQVS